MAGSKPTEQILTNPPIICIEILYKDDRISAMQERISDYLKFGVRYVWVVDPYSRTAWTYTSEGAVEVKDWVLRTKDPDIEMPLSEILR